MGNGQLQNKRVAILATDGFEQSELFEPKRLLEEQGADVKVISLKSGDIKAWKGGDWGKTIAVDLTLDSASPEDFDVLVLPGGVINPDKLRLSEPAIEFIRQFGSTGKVIAAICHGPWTLINAGLVKGRRVTSWPSLRADLTNAGADWADEEVIVDQGIITSRKPDDIPAFVNKIIEETLEGPHTRRMTSQPGASAQPETSMRH